MCLIETGAWRAVAPRRPASVVGPACGDQNTGSLVGRIGARLMTEATACVGPRPATGCTMEFTEGVSCDTRSAR
jgi:hypothetical protein